MTEEDTPPDEDAENSESPQETGLGAQLDEDTAFGSGWSLRTGPDEKWYVCQSENGGWLFVTDDGNEVKIPDEGSLDDAPSFDSSGHAQLAHKAWLDNDDREVTELTVDGEDTDADDDDSRIGGILGDDEDAESEDAVEPENDADDDRHADEWDEGDADLPGESPEVDYSDDPDTDEEDSSGGRLSRLNPFGGRDEDDEQPGEGDKKWWEYGNDAGLGDEFRGKVPEDADVNPEEFEGERDHGPGEWHVEGDEDYDYDEAAPPRESSDDGVADPAEDEPIETEGDGISDLDDEEYESIEGDGIAETSDEDGGFLGGVRRSIVESLPPQIRPGSGSDSDGEDDEWDEEEWADDEWEMDDEYAHEGEDPEAAYEEDEYEEWDDEEDEYEYEAADEEFDEDTGGTLDEDAAAEGTLEGALDNGDFEYEEDDEYDEYDTEGGMDEWEDDEWDETTEDDSPLARVKDAFSDTGLFQGETNEELRNFDWGEEIETAQDKVERARSGDEEAERDVRDAPRRIAAKFRLDPNAKEDLWDMLLPLTLAGSGFFLLFITLLADPGTPQHQLLTVPTSYADLFLVSTVVLMVTAFGFWVSRKSEGYDNLRRVCRIALAVLQLVPLGLFSLMAGSFLFNQAELFAAFEDTWMSVKVSLNTSLPEFLTAIGHWYASNAPLGVTIRDSAVLMLFVGVLAGGPFLVRVAKQALIAFNEPAPARDAKPDLAQEHFGDTAKMDASGAGTTADLEGLDTTDNTSALMSLPDEMRHSPFKGYEEVRRYWVKAPYAYVSIVYNDEQNDHRYVVVEPEMDQSERALMGEFDERLSTALLFEDVEEHEHDDRVEEKVRRLEDKVLELAAEYNIDASDESFHKLLYYLERNYIFYNKIDPFMNDPHVEDISCDGDDKFIFVFHQDYNDLMTNVKFQRDELRSFIVQLAQRSGEHISAADPMCDASLPDGSRAQLTLGNEITTDGSTFTIRLFKEIPFTPVDLLKYRTFDVNQMAYLWLAIEHDKSLIFAGGTASGKTTSMNAVSLFIPPKAKVVTLEDTREISLPHDNWIPGTTRDSVGAAGGEEIDMYKLLRAALRQRPEYLVVGEIRGEEAETLFQAMSTGHTTYSTMHADNVERAIGRLENPPIDVPRAMIDSLDIICIQQQVRLFDEESGDVKNVRRNMTTTEIIGMRSDGSFITHPAYRRDAERDEFIEQLDDSHVLEDIREEQGWTYEELEEELQERKEVLMYLVNNDITQFDAVARTIQAYMVDSERVIEEVRNDTLEPDSFTDITSAEFGDPDEKLTDITAPDEMLDEITDDDESGEAPLEGESE